MKIVAKPIKMIASFDDKGVINPIKFQVEESGELIVVRVNKVISWQEVKPAGVESIIYICQSLIGEIEKLYELKYRVKEHRWELYKI